jgi:hypothetical protein
MRKGNFSRMREWKWFAKRLEFGVNTVHRPNIRRRFGALCEFSRGDLGENPSSESTDSLGEFSGLNNGRYVDVEPPNNETSLLRVINMAVRRIPTIPYRHV